MPEPSSQFPPGGLKRFFAEPGLLGTWLKENSACLLILILFAAFFLQTEPISRDSSHYYRMILAFLTLVLLTTHLVLLKVIPCFSFPFFKKTARAAEKVFYTAAIILALGGVFNYYQFDGDILFGGGDYADVTYYYLNSKYFTELGYYELYPAMLLADEEGDNHLKQINRYRDLYTYSLVERSAVRHSKVQSSFSAGRWEEFKGDVGFFTAHGISGGWAYFFSDHGYNAPPTWTLIGGALSNAVPVERLKWITAIDIVLVVVMFVLIGKTFGANAVIYSLLFFVVTFSGRWPILGQSLLRFDWLAALAAAMCMLKKERFALAGALVMYATLSRVFPVLFFIPLFFYSAFNIFRNGRAGRQAKDLIAGAALIFIIMVAAALIYPGQASFQQSGRNLQMHAQTYSSHRVGLGDAVFFRFEKTREEMALHGGITAKKEAINNLKPFLYWLGLLSAAGLGLYTYHKKPALHELFSYPVLTLFIMQNPQVHYFNIRILLVMLHCLDLKKTRNQVGLALLFLIEVLAQWTKIAGFERYTTTAATSLGLGIYFTIMIIITAGNVLRSPVKQQGTSRQTSPKCAPL